MRTLMHIRPWKNKVAWIKTVCFIWGKCGGGGEGGVLRLWTSIGKISFKTKIIRNFSNYLKFILIKRAFFTPEFTFWGGGGGFAQNGCRTPVFGCFGEELWPRFFHRIRKSLQLLYSTDGLSYFSHFRVGFFFSIKILKCFVVLISFTVFQIREMYVLYTMFCVRNLSLNIVNTSGRMRLNIFAKFLIWTFLVGYF